MSERLHSATESTSPSMRRQAGGYSPDVKQGETGQSTADHGSGELFFSRGQCSVRLLDIEAGRCCGTSPGAGCSHLRQALND